MKKIALILTAALLCLSLAACSKNEDPSNTAVGKSNLQLQPTKQEEKKDYTDKYLASQSLTFNFDGEVTAENIAKKAAETFFAIYMQESTPANKKIESYEITGINPVELKSDNSKDSAKMSYQYVAQITYKIVTLSDEYSAENDDISGKGTFENLYREICIKNQGDGKYEIVTVGDGMGNILLSK